MAAAEWVDPQADRVLSRQRGQVDSAKVVATFAAGIAGALVASALQVPPVTDDDRWSIYALAAAAVLVLVVTQLDRIREADHAEILDLVATGALHPTQFAAQLEGQTLWAIRINEKTVRVVRWALFAQIVLATISGVEATRSLLG